MSILDANGSVACAECGRKARDERDRLQAENEKLRELAATAWWIAENLCQAFDGSCESCPHGERDDRCVYEKIQRDLLDMGVEVAL